jgi:hypothetical protein
MVKRTLFFRILFLTSSFVLFILSSIIIYFQIVFSRTIDEIESISASMIYSPFAYAYIQFILSIILLVFSGLYAIAIIKDSKKQFKGQKIQKKEKKKTISDDISIESEIEKSIKLPEKPDSIKNQRVEEKIAEIDKLLAKKESDEDIIKADEDLTKNELDTQTQDIIPPEKEDNNVEEETKEEPDKDIEQEPKENVQIKHPFPEKKPKRVIDKSDELKLSKHFEKVLSSAIEKKQSEIKPKKQIEKEIIKEERVELTQIKSKQDLIQPDSNNKCQEDDIKEDLAEKILKVKCPGCNHIFPFNKESGKKIICPKCGKEGNIEIKI